LDKADRGQLIIDGVQVNQLNDTDLAAFRNQKIGFVFQFHHLLPEFTALENICIPAYIGGMSKKDAIERAEELLKYLNLIDRKDHKPSELSGGEQQRVAVARALINKPAVVLADEPSGNLDSKSAQELHKLFFRLRDEMQQTFVIVTHNPELASMSDRTITIKDGKI
jgi:lipoprotein-releasing system ATP-binding protein